MGFKNFLKGPTTNFNAVDDETDGLKLHSDYEIAADDIIIFLKHKGINITKYDSDTHTFNIKKMYVVGLDHKGTIASALQSIFHKLDISTNGVISYENYELKKLTISTNDKKVNVEFSKPKKKKKKAIS